MDRAYQSANAAPRLGVLIVAMVAAGCGVPGDPSAHDSDAPELTFVALDQYSTPALVNPAGTPALYQVSVDVTVVFRFADHLETLVVDIDGPRSGQRSHNQFELGDVAPDIAAMTQGRAVIRLPITTPELGALQFSATLIDQGGRTSRAVEGGFTVQSVLGANDTSQTQTTQAGNTTTVQVP